MRQKLAAYSTAVAISAVMTVTEDFYLRHHPLMTGQDVAIFIFNLERLLSFIVPGYVAALMIRQQGVLTGALAGLLAQCVFDLYIFLFRHIIYHDWYWGLAWGALLGGLGGLLWTLQTLVMKFTRPGKI